MCSNVHNERILFHWVIQIHVWYYGVHPSASADRAGWVWILQNLITRQLLFSRNDFFCHEISAHIPHHTTLRIPSRNLHEACASLQINWDMHLNKADFDVSLKTTIGTQCNLFDDRKKRSVKFEKASRNSSGVGLITVQKSKSVCMGWMLAQM